MTVLQDQPAPGDEGGVVLIPGHLLLAFTHGNLEAQNFGHRQMEKHRWEELEERREGKKDQRRENQKKEDAGVGTREGNKSRNTVLFQWFVAPEG